MSKEERQKIFDKYGGKCAYCGCELQKGWHVDHCAPVHRVSKIVGGNYVTKDTGVEPTEHDIENGNYKKVPLKRVPDGMLNPKNHCIENMMPSCASCNLYKHSADLETFRMMLQRTIQSLNRDRPQYRFAKKYGLVQETGIEVTFYFETLTKSLTNG